MHSHQLLDHPLFEERPIKEALEPFGFEVSIITVDAPIDPALDDPEAMEAYANNPETYIDLFGFEHPAGFTEVSRGENDDGEIFSAAVRAKHVFAQLLLCADSAFAGPSNRYDRAYMDLYRERMRQLSTEGFSRERDDGYVQGELAAAAGCYALTACLRAGAEEDDDQNGGMNAWKWWPWSAKWWKPSTDPRRNLVKAGALILAEIERLDRAAEKQGDEE